MPPHVIHLPDGQNFTVKPVFSGVFFKSNELSTQSNAYPIGWTVVLNTTEEEDAGAGRNDSSQPNGNGSNGSFDRPVDGLGNSSNINSSHPRIRSFTKPTLQNDNLFISSVSLPSSAEYKPPASPTRQIAMMLWVSLYWYFHQAEPLPYLRTEASKNTPDDAKPKGDWMINIKQDGVLRGRNLIPKLERMGLIASVDSTVSDESEESWTRMFVSKKMFWQIPGRLFLFSLQHNTLGSSRPGSPPCSRPGTPLSPYGPPYAGDFDQSAMFSVPTTTITTAPPAVPSGPFHSNSHLPTYYPPGPLAYTTTNNVRHPLRPKPPRMGEVFYARYVPSMGHYLSFRVASTSTTPVQYRGPLGPNPPEHVHLRELSDTALLQSWLSKPRVSKFWGEWTPDFLTNAVKSQHSFPVIGMWDGIPFGYFEIYWVKEDPLGQKLGDLIADFDRGLHILIGEEWARGRVPTWLTSLVHWSLAADYRTMSICLEPRVDNERLVLLKHPSSMFLLHLHKANFSRERQVAFPHKQAWFVRMRREDWEGPAL
ncbi:hypothetical protein jhhlp_001573 [Lomentospora prolificans]|uniref:Acyltransferase MbtK/IucB-like conserved domain-containing protein n=1 Tax=Lomentospora prolificans TaxID=41688 RepID=A0A2N3NIL1_9PEZI|nr:hypothetical protein jhhlp_001573 [Lomentospora prolificans]